MQSPAQMLAVYMQPIAANADSPSLPARPQADTYRRMLKLTRGAWASPFPATNTLWLHYMADIILTSKAPAGAGWRAEERRALRDFRRRALAYGSCQEAIWDELFEGLWVAQAAE